MAASQYRSIGRLTNGRTAYVAPELVVWWALFQRLVLLTVRKELEIIQALGAGKFSGGTHGHPGAALDLRSWRFTLWVCGEIVRLAREAGAPGTWYRTRAQGFDPHFHLVVDILRWSPALYQIMQAKQGRNGLRGNTRDDGPRPSEWRNYRTGIVWMHGQIARLENKTAPGLPKPPAPPVTKPTTGGLTMADVNTIMAELADLRDEIALVRAENAYTKKQNETLHRAIVDAPLKVWQFPVWRTIKGKRAPVAIIQDLANMNTQLAAVAAQVGQE